MFLGELEAHLELSTCCDRHQLGEQRSVQHGCVHLRLAAAGTVRRPRHGSGSFSGRAGHKRRTSLVHERQKLLGGHPPRFFVVGFFSCHTLNMFKGTYMHTCPQVTWTCGIFCDVRHLISASVAHQPSTSDSYVSR